MPYYHFEIRRKNTGYLSNPSDACRTPAKNVAVKAKCKYKAGSSFADTVFPNMDATSSDATATVPTAKSFELPIIAYTSGGTKLESANKHSSICYHLLSSLIVPYH